MGILALMDGRTISVPLAWYPRLLRVSKELLSNWEIAGGGIRHPLAGFG
jgi:hypothetical protein